MLIEYCPISMRYVVSDSSLGRYAAEAKIGLSIGNGRFYDCA